MTLLNITEGPIRTEVRGRVLEVTIDRPKANAIDAATSRVMGEVFSAFRDDDTLRAAILTATGERFFCPGWDLKAAAEGRKCGCRLWPGRLWRPAGIAGPQQAGGVRGQRTGLRRRLRDHDFLRHHHCRRARNFRPAGNPLRRHCRCRHHQAATPHPLPRRHGNAADRPVVDCTRPGTGASSMKWCRRDQLMARAREVADKLAGGPPLVYAAIKEVLERTHHLNDKEALALLNRRGLPASRSFMPRKTSWKAQRPSPRSATRSGRANSPRHWA